MKVYTGFKAAISAAVPSLAGRIFPVNAMESYATPYCAYELTSSDKLQTLNGYEDETQFDYQFNFYHTSYDTAKANAEAFWDYIKNFSGAFGDCFLEEVEYLNETDDSDAVGGKVWYNAIIEIKFKTRR